MIKGRMQTMQGEPMSTIYAINTRNLLRKAILEMMRCFERRDSLLILRRIWRLSFISLAIQEALKGLRFTQRLHEAPLVFSHTSFLVPIQSMLGSVRPRSAHGVNADRNERETNTQSDMLAGHESQVARFEHTAQRG
jgi:hypothetical protein